MKGICFIELLFEKTISGDKTETRRTGGLDEVNKNPQDWEFYFFDEEGNAIFLDNETGNVAVCTPRYKEKEIVFLKEPYHVNNDGTIVFKYLNNDHENINKWENKLFMRAKYARYFVKIIAVECQRLGEIDEQGIIAEGVERYDDLYRDYSTGLPAYIDSYWLSFKSLVELANRKKIKGNPYVFVYHLKLVKYEQPK